MRALSGGASASRRRPVILSWVPCGRIQSTLLPFSPETHDPTSHPAQMLRSALMYQGPKPKGSALGSFGGWSRTACVSAHVMDNETMSVDVSAIALVGAE